MAVSIRSNIASLMSQNRLTKVSQELGNVFSRLSSGLRINKASDDSAGLAVSESLGADARVYTQGVRNVNDGISLLNIADGALSELTTIAVRLEELAIQAGSGSLSNSQRASLDQEAQALSDEYRRIAQSTSFNDQNILAGDLDSLLLQTGYGSSGSILSSLGGAISDGTYQSVLTTDAFGTVQYGVELADLNGDGDLDLISAATGSAEEITVRFGDGSGGFGTATGYDADSSGVRDLELADVDNDGVLDIITGGSVGAASTSILLGNGDGTFQSATTYTHTGTSVSDVSLADLDGDGNLDLVSSGSNGAGFAWVQLGNGDGTFGADTTYSTESGNSFSGVLDDFDGDGNLDLITGGNGATAEFSVRLGNGDGTFEGSNINVGFGGGGGFVNTVQLQDIDGDGNQDVVLGGAGATGFVDVRFGDGSGGFSSTSSYMNEALATGDVEFVDLNNDGLLDMASSGLYAGGGQVSVRYRQSDGSFGEVESFTSIAGNSADLELADINGDGVLDYINAGQDSGSGAYGVHMANTVSGVSSINPFSLETQADALQAVSLFGGVTERLSLHRGVVGSFLSRLDSAQSVTQSQADNYEVARSRIRDVDVATETARLVSLQIQQQATAAILAQSNQQPEIALSLLQTGR